jgi:hypothetical protein
VVDNEGLFGVLSLKISIALVSTLLCSFSVPRYKKVSEKMQKDKILGLFLESKKLQTTFIQEFNTFMKK